ncbi:MAG: hypothetical protein KDC83_15450 [Flavobacteriales bacterium]|nr:hypothetical protein [Flavobacteriales bacterium]MCB8925343.1 hypothetical protein [Ardenticatenaceae bacterium]
MSLDTKLVLIDDQSGNSHFINEDIHLHDYLTDNADWNAEYWDFDEEYLQEYAKKLERIYCSSGYGFEFQALWVGEYPTEIRHISIDDFLKIVKGNQISTKTRYVVRKPT